MGIIRTLNGDISAHQLGVTYSHDHIYCIPPYWAERQDDDLLLDDPQASERELSDFREAGGRAIYDATAPDYGRQAAAVAAMAQRQQLHIIATAGFNKGFLWSSKRPGSAQTFAEWIEHSEIDELVEHVCREVTEGIEGTAHRAGVVKCGTGYNTISPLEEKTMEVIVRAQQRTNAQPYGNGDDGTRAGADLQKMGAGFIPLMFCPYGSQPRSLAAPSDRQHRGVSLFRRYQPHQIPP